MKTKNIGVVRIEQTKNFDTYHFQLEFGDITFKKTISNRDEGIDEEYIKEYWFRLKCWAHIIDTFRMNWVVLLAIKYL